MTKLFILLALLSQTPALAGDASSFLNLGFSSDGNYFAFVEYGTGDGSGAAYASGTVVDVYRNKVIATKHVNLIGPGEEANGDEDKAIKLAAKGLNLSKYGIRAGKNLGEVVLARHDTDFSSYTSTVFSVDYWAQGGASSVVPKYELSLTEGSTEDKTEEKWCSAMTTTGPMIFTLKLSGASEAHEPFEKILQQDTHLPKSRGECVYSYGIQSVIHYKGKLVIQMTFQEPGFEGPNYRKMVVTGSL